MDDIEDTVPSNLNEFIKELSSFVFDEEKDFQKRYNEMKVKYKLCPSKPQMRKMYNELIIQKEILPNKGFLQYSLKRKCRSTSGVSVITILTSPTPAYTNYKGEKVQQKFSCGENCAYCPNEPEVRLILEINDINVSKNQIKVYTEDNINLIRVLSYIIKGEDKLKIYQFHSKIAKHYFCSNCGIYTHHNPRSNPAMTGFNIGCIDEINTFNLKDVPVNDGQNHPLDQKK